MTYRQLRLKDRSVSYVCKTSQYTIPWTIDDPTTVHAEFVKGNESQPLEYGEEFTVDCDTSMLTLLTNYNNSDTLHIFEGERLKYIAKSSAKHSPKTLTRRLDDCMEEVNKIPPQIQSVEESLKDEINKIPPKIDKVEKEIKEEIKANETVIQAHSLSLIDQIKTLEEHEKRLTETATKEDISNLKDSFVTPAELQSLLENTIAKTQEDIKILEQEIKDLKTESCCDIESLKAKLEDLVTAQEKLKKFEDRIRVLENKPPVDLTPLNTKIDSVDTRVKSIENKPPVDLTPVETKVKALEEKANTLEEQSEDIRNAYIVDIPKLHQDVTTITTKTDNIETGAKNLSEVVSTLCQRVDNVDIIQMDRDVTALASKSLEADKTTGKLKADVGTLQEDHGKVKADVTALASKSLETIKHVESLNAENNTLKTQLKDLEDRIKALEPLKDKFNSSGDLVLRATERNKAPGISFKGQDGKDEFQMFTRDGVLFTGRNDGAGKLSPCIKLTPDGFKVDGRSVQEHIRGEINGRTTIRCAKLHADRKVGDDVIDSTSIDNWQYPAENSDGYLSHSAAYAIGLDDADKNKRWKVIGKTIGYYGWWHWLQEVIE